MQSQRCDTKGPMARGFSRREKYAKRDMVRVTTVMIIRSIIRHTSKMGLYLGEDVDYCARFRISPFFERFENHRFLKQSFFKITRINVFMKKRKCRRRSCHSCVFKYGMCVKRVFSKSKRVFLKIFLSFLRNHCVKESSRDNLAPTARGPFEKIR